MATLQELRGLFRDSDLLEKVESATVIAANNLLEATPTAADKAWASGVFSNPFREAQKVLMAVLADNSNATVDQIKGAGVAEAAHDATIQSSVDTVVPDLVDALAGV